MLSNTDVTLLHGATNTRSLHLAVAVLGHSVWSRRNQKTPTLRQQEIKKNPGISKFGVCPIINGVEGRVGKQALAHLTVVYFAIFLVARNIWHWIVEISVSFELQWIEKEMFVA